MIEVNEYVRTDNGEIHKVLDTEKGSIKIKSQYKEWIGLCCIKKHSKQLIDLIEVGDYVNGTVINENKTIDIILNLAGDVKKENQGLKDYINRLDKSSSKDFYFKHEAIPKEKIKEKIKYIQGNGLRLFTTARDRNKCMNILQDLLIESEK